MAKKDKKAKPEKPGKPGKPTETDTEPAQKAKVTVGPTKVRATQAGYYDNARRREGDVFTIQNSGEFSEKWMEKVDKSTPEKTTTGQEVINRDHDDVLKDKLAGRATGGANPLGA